ncbi:hypothetical protein ACCT02_14675 [Rhizobium ruizarguesonis]
MSTSRTVDEERRLSRNLTLAINTVVSCGHAMRVTLADLLQDFDDIRGEPGSNTSYLCEKLERVLAEDAQQNRRVSELLGLEVIANEGSL